MSKSAKSKDRRKAASGTAVAARCRDGPRSAVRHGDRSRAWRAWTKFWKRSAWRCAESATRIWRIGRRCVRDTWRAPWCWVDGGSRYSARGRAVWRGHELRLPSWREWSARDPLEQRAVEQMVLGVSTRALRALAGTIAGSSRGTGHQQERGERAVRLWHRAQAGRADEPRTTSSSALVALLIDGVHFAEHVVLAAVGVDERGDKHVLGLREGATENAAAVRALLADLVERGLDTDRSLLVVIDGAKALHKAVVEGCSARMR